MKPATARTLDTLRAAGKRGCSTHDLLAAGCGSRFGARIAELRAAGYDIATQRERQGSWRYRLLSEPAEAGAGLPDRDDSTVAGCASVHLSGSGATSLATEQGTLL